jgi:hypothetical protein
VTDVIALVLVLAVLVLVTRAAWAIWRFARLPRQAKRHYPAMYWHRFRWRWLARAAGLAWVDQHRRRIFHPLSFGTRTRIRTGSHSDYGWLRWPRGRWRADAYGWTVRIRAVPKATAKDFEDAAPTLCAAWRCHRVSVNEPKPGRLVVRGMRRDPLTEPVPASVLPPFHGRYVLLGRDEWGQLRHADLANLSGSTFSGSPGRGKTEAALSLAVQLTPSPAVDYWILDGGACDWSRFAAGAAGYVADDLAAAGDMLAELDARMTIRRRNLPADLGTRNGWSAGPTPGYRLQWVLVDEAPFFLDFDVVKGDRKREDQVRACRGLLAGLLRRGRAPLFHTTLIAQKGTGTGGLPPDLRDLCGLRWSFGVATTEAAAAILGDDIRQHPTMTPTLFQGPEHVGVASVLLRTGQSPYTLIKFPAISDDLAGRAAVTAARNRSLEYETAGA